MTKEHQRPSTASNNLTFDLRMSLIIYLQNALVIYSTIIESSNYEFLTSTEFGAFVQLMGLGLSNVGVVCY